jgi:hypothetical protein
LFLLNFKEYDLKLFFNILFLKKSILQKECYTTGKNLIIGLAECSASSAIIS